MLTTLLVKEKDGLFNDLKASNSFVEITVIKSTMTEGYTAQIKFKKAGSVFITLTLTNSNFKDILNNAQEDFTWSLSNPLYGISNVGVGLNVIHLMNIDINASDKEIKLFKESINAVGETISQHKELENVPLKVCS